MTLKIAVSTVRFALVTIQVEIDRGVAWKRRCTQFVSCFEIMGVSSRLLKSYFSCIDLINF